MIPTSRRSRYLCGSLQSIQPMARRPASGKPSLSRAARKPAPAKAAPAAKARKAVAKVAEKLDPTQPTASRAQSGKSGKRPAIEALVRVARGSLPVALARRFIDADLLSQSAALALYALLSLAPLLLILVWLTSGILPDAQEALMAQIGALVGAEAEQVARTIVSNAEQRPDTGSIAGMDAAADGHRGHLAGVCAGVRADVPLPAGPPGRLAQGAGRGRGDRAAVHARACGDCLVRGSCRSGFGLWFDGNDRAGVGLDLLRGADRLR
ncbi:MAG: hypothetical protein EOP91_12330, partial [Lysobacteraceae bacterium]